jgi:transcriptional regulator with XRE-family HTH domain
MMVAGMFSYVFKYRHGLSPDEGLNHKTLTLTTNTVNVVPLSYVNLVDFSPRIRDESSASRTLPVEIEMITPNEFYSKLGDSIRQRREELGLTQEELGESLGLSRTSVTNIERGRQRLLIDQFQLVCKALDQPADTLLAKAESVLQRLVETRPSELKRMPTVSAYLKKTLVRAGDR